MNSHLQKKNVQLFYPNELFLIAFLNDCKIVYDEVSFLWFENLGCRFHKKDLWHLVQKQDPTGCPDSQHHHL
jgi:hypothetical protein